MKMNARVIQNKLFINGEPQPLRHGDVEQIKAIKKLAQVHQELVIGKKVWWKEYFDIDYDDEAKIEITVECLCAAKVNFQLLVDRDDFVENEDYTDDFLGKAEHCHKCNKKYVTDLNEDYELVIKLY